MVRLWAMSYVQDQPFQYWTSMRKQDGIHLSGITMVGLSGSIQMAFKTQTIWHPTPFQPFEYQTSLVFRYHCIYSYPISMGLPHPLQVGGLFDGWQGSTKLVCGPEVTKSSVGQFPDEPLTVCNRAFAVVLVQLVHHHAQTVDETSRRNLLKNML